MKFLPVNVDMKFFACQHASQCQHAFFSKHACKSHVNMQHLFLMLRFRSTRVHAAQTRVCWRAQSTVDSLFFIDVPTNPGPRSIDRPFMVLTETKSSNRHIPVWARYSPHRTRVEAHANTLSPWPRRCTGDIPTPRKTMVEYYVSYLSTPLGIHYYKWPTPMSHTPTIVDHARVTVMTFTSPPWGWIQLFDPRGFRAIIARW